MFKSLRLIDFNRNNFLEETIIINIAFPGAFSYFDLGEMYFDEYEKILEYAKQFIKKKGISYFHG